ncbi:hypothetical protein ZWY2020_039385 [Hordeum vulgare]|nr:hypothetical protein ZWY2020_039385 [Hordeum vulgare]
MIPRLPADDCWCQVKAKYPSDLSDNMQLMDKTWVMFNVEAQAMYLEEVKRRFAYNHCWKVVWDQPKWKSYILSLTSRKPSCLSLGTTSSSEDTEDDPDKEISEEGSVTAKEKYEGKGEVEKDIQCSQDLQNMLKTNPGEMIGVQLLHADQNLEPSRIETLERKDDEALISEKQPELLMTAASWYNEFLPGSELSAGNSKFSELQHGGVLREDEPEKGTLKQGYKALDHDRATAMENLPEKDNTQVVEEARSWESSEENVPESKTVDLQTMLMKDREKMSEVQLRLSKEKLEFAKLKQQEAKDKKETTLYEKYSELLMADTSRFSDFQKAEYEKAVKRMGEMLFGRDDR